MLFDWKSILLFIGASQGFILGILLLLSLGKQSYKRIFGWLMILFAFHLTELGIFFAPNSFNKVIHLFGYRYPIRLSIGPLFFFYTVFLIQKTKLNFQQIFIHFIPAVAAFVLLSPLIFKATPEKLHVLNNFVPFGSLYDHKIMSALSVISVFSMFFYVFFSLKKIIRYRRISFEYHSNESKIWMTSFYYFTWICLIALLGYLIAVILRQFQWYDATNLYLAMSLLLTLSLIMLTIVIMNQNRVIPIEITTIKSEQGQSDEFPVVTPDQLMELENIMKQKRVYLNPNLTIKDLANQLELPPYLVSKRINQGYQKTFFRFVNVYRIEHAKELLINSDIKILAVALDSGFTNKSSFHRTFKRIEGITPSEYRSKYK